MLGSFDPAARRVVLAAAVAILVLTARAAADLLGPILLAVFISILAAGPLRWLRRQGVPKYLALGVIVFVLLDIGSLAALLVTGALEGFHDNLPTYQQRLALLTAELGGWLESLGLADAEAAVPDLLDPRLLGRAVRAGLANAGGVFATGLLVLLAVVFMLLEAPGIPAKLRLAFGGGEEIDARLDRIATSIKRYMAIKAAMSLLTAVIVFAWLRYLSIGFAAPLAVLAFILNFIPFVGALFMMIPAILLAVLEADLATAGLVAAGYVIANTAVGSVLEPRIMGRGLGVSTLVVFLSLLFWGWVLGTPGVFLSVPLTMVLIIVLAANPGTRAIAVLLGPEAAPSPGPVVTQAGPPHPEER